MVLQRVSLVSAFVYGRISLFVAAAFLLATAFGEYTAVERAGGAVWILFLSAIILIPVITPRIRRRMDETNKGWRRNSPQGRRG